MSRSGKFVHVLLYNTLARKSDKDSWKALQPKDSLNWQQRKSHGRTSKFSSSSSIRRIQGKKFMGHLPKAETQLLF
eukprot:1058932-Pelagomonas_calceolata.AAC.6